MKLLLQYCVLSRRDTEFWSSGFSLKDQTTFPVRTGYHVSQKAEVFLEIFLERGVILDE